MATVHVHTEYDPPPSAGLDCSNKPDMAQQQFKDECDINTIVDQYQAHIPLPTPPMFGDFAQVADFTAAQFILLEAQSHFAALPAKVRSRFANDPAQLLAFVNDPKNADEAIALGIAQKKPTPPPAPVQQVVVGTLDANGNFIPQAATPTTPPAPATK